MDEESTYLSVKESAKFLFVTQRTIRRYIKQQTLPAYRVTGSNTIRIKRIVLGELLEPVTPIQKTE